MARVYIAIGSNIDAEMNIIAALGFLRSKGHITGLSTIYRTQSLGCVDAPEFYNGVIELETCFEARALKFDVLRPIEESLGRVRTQDKNAPRPIDLDILLHGESVIDEPGLRIPDPEIAERAFLAIPLLELRPKIVLPGKDQPLRDEAAHLDAGAMIPLEDFTHMLREELHIEPRESC